MSAPQALFDGAYARDDALDYLIHRER